VTNDELQTKVQTERDNADEVIVEAVFWDHRLLFRKTYHIEQSGLPESYFEMLSVVFEEHIRVAEVINKLLKKSLMRLQTN
jgi:hypothetical protein